MEEVEIEEANQHYNTTIKETNEIKVFYLYINKDNEIYNIRSENEILENKCLTKERILYLIKKNQYYLVNNHRLVSILKYNINLKNTEIKNFIYNDNDNDNNNNNYLSSLKLLESIYFHDTIDIMQSLNSVFFIFTNNIKTSHRTTKRIIIKPVNNKTRTNRKISTA